MQSPDAPAHRGALIVAIISVVAGLLSSPIWGPPICRAVGLCSEPASVPPTSESGPSTVSMPTDKTTPGPNITKESAAPPPPPLPPDTCKTGFVWREAAPDDHVCVEPATRDQTRLDNDVAAERRVSSDDATCVSGYVWREAFPADLVCVTPETRAQAWQDNSLAASRVVG
jgi:hypothetical protein